MQLLLLILMLMQLEVSGMITSDLTCIMKSSISMSLDNITRLVCFSGLDDLRDWTNNVQPSVPIYTAERDFEVLVLFL